LESEENLEKQEEAGGRPMENAINVIEFLAY
jgi:hypothetical protein